MTSREDEACASMSTRDCAVCTNPAPADSRCVAMCKSTGNRCPRRSRNGKTTCWQHDAAQEMVMNNDLVRMPSRCSNIIGTVPGHALSRMRPSEKSSRIDTETQVSARIPLFFTLPPNNGGRRTKTLAFTRHYMLGKGSSGNVLAYHNIETGDQFALKGGNVDDDRKAVRLLRQCGHQCLQWIVPAHAPSGPDQNYILMERHVSLSALMPDRMLSSSTDCERIAFAVEVILRMTEAMLSLKRAGLSYGDIKPSNFIFECVPGSDDDDEEDHMRLLVADLGSIQEHNSKNKMTFPPPHFKQFSQVQEKHSVWAIGITLLMLLGWQHQDLVRWNHKPLWRSKSHRSDVKRAFADAGRSSGTESLVMGMLAMNSVSRWNLTETIMHLNKFLHSNRCSKRQDVDSVPDLQRAVSRRQQEEEYDDSDLVPDLIQQQPSSHRRGGERNQQHDFDDLVPDFIHRGERNQRRDFDDLVPDLINNAHDDDDDMVPDLKASSRSRPRSRPNKPTQRKKKTKHRRKITSAGNAPNAPNARSVGNAPNSPGAPGHVPVSDSALQKLASMNLEAMSSASAMANHVSTQVPMFDQFTGELLPSPWGGNAGGTANQNLLYQSPMMMPLPQNQQQQMPMMMVPPQNQPQQMPMMMMPPHNQQQQMPMMMMPPQNQQQQMYQQPVYYHRNI